MDPTNCRRLISRMPKTTNATSVHSGAEAGEPPARRIDALDGLHQRIDPPAKESRRTAERIDAPRANRPVERADDGDEDAQIQQYRLAPPARLRRSPRASSSA